MKDRKCSNCVNLPLCQYYHKCLPDLWSDSMKLYIYMTNRNESNLCPFFVRAEDENMKHSEEIHDN